MWKKDIFKIHINIETHKKVILDLIKIVTKYNVKKMITKYRPHWKQHKKITAEQKIDMEVKIDLKKQNKKKVNIDWKKGEDTGK